MTGFSVKLFGGVIPRLDPRNLPNNAGQLADNTKMFSGRLESWHKTTAINTPTKGTAAGTELRSMYRMYSTSSDIWLSWADDVDVVRGPIAGDTSFKVYYTGDTTTGSNYVAGPRKTNLDLARTGGTNYPREFLEMGVPAPGAAPTVTGTGGTSTNSISRTYLYTYVTGTASGGWNEEGPPSPLGTGTGKTDAVWCISSMSTGTTGKYAFAGATKNLYRGLTDNAGNTNFQKVASVVIATSSYNDSVADDDLGVICPSFINGIVNSEWVAPPSDLRGLIALPNGIMAGFSGNNICFCEPFFPHAWPIRYRLTANFDIVSLGRYGQTLIVTTKGFPYAVAGVRPDAMAMAMIEENLPCVSKRSTVSFPFGVAWATPDGLALAGVGGAVNVIEPFMKRDEWRALCFPDTIIARQFQDIYFGFFNNGVSDLNFVFDKTNPQGPLAFGNFGAQGAWSDPETAKLYLMQNNMINQWDGDSLNLSPFDWRSKIFRLPNPLNFGAMEVDADYGAFNDGVASAAQAVADEAINTIIIGTANADTALLTQWVGTTSYSTGAIVKSSDHTKMAICLNIGTSGASEFTFSGTLGGTSTDGTVLWRRIWELEGRTKGSMNGHVLGYHVQHDSSDPVGDGVQGSPTVAGNLWGFPLGGSLLVGGAYPNYDDRYLQLRVYAQGTATQTSLVYQKNLTSRNAFRLPQGFKSDEWEIRISGSVAVRYFKIAQTMAELAKIS